MLPLSRSERSVRRTLRKLSRQRVALVLQPGDVWVVEYAVGDDVETVANLRTCHMRGWVEPLCDSVPTGNLEGFHRTREFPRFTHEAPIYQLTDEGWIVLKRDRLWIVLGTAVGLASLAAAVLLR